MGVEPTPLPELQRATFQLRGEGDTGALVDQDETLPIPTSLATRPALPFAGMTSLERLAWLSSERGPSTIPEDANPDETLPIPRSAPSPGTGTFRDRLGAVEVPVLSLDEYVELRARLLVCGEDHAPTLARFGVLVRPVHAALKARFAEYFERAPEARAAFVDALAARVAELRAGR
ncbi:MAG: hypothetical protein IPG04_12650 [Polyangiaceae bacterium]|nr:hypothetical protein [Polyangiaceae bacterium]